MGGSSWKGSSSQMWKLVSQSSGLDFMEESGELLGSRGWWRRDDLIKVVVCEEGESDWGRNGENSGSRS